MSEKEYWNKFYDTCDWIPKEPSTFARWCLSFFDLSYTIIEFGCGSGRDALFFVKKGLKRVLAIDIASHTIEKLKTIETVNNISFVSADFTKLPPKENLGVTTLNVVYARFTLHAIRKTESSQCLKWAYDNLNTNGLLCIEARSVKGDMYGKGTPVDGEKDAFIFGHYRRFIRSEELVTELKELGFTIENIVEDSGLAVFRDDDPVVVRVIAKKT